MILAAYGIRKAYKKHEAKKAQKQLLGRDGSSINDSDPSSEIQSVSSASSFRQYRDGGHPVAGGLVNYTNSTNSSATNVKPSSLSTRTDYSASIYSQSSAKDPLDEIRQYQAYVERQSYDFRDEIEPPAYEHVSTPHKPNQISSANAPERPVDRSNEVRYDYRVPVGAHRITELDTSSESSAGTAHKSNSAVQRSSTIPEPEPQSAISELSAEDMPALMPAPLRIRKSLEQGEEQSVELPARDLERSVVRKRQYQSDSGEEDDDDHKSDVVKQASSSSVEVVV